MLKRIVEVRENEVWALILSFLYFFFLLCSYYILRPVRDEMGIQSGVGNLQWLFTGTFLVMLAAVPVFGAAVARLPKRKLVPFVYYFFILNLVIFFLSFKSSAFGVWVARAFFIWLSVFNLFVVSVFWSFMVDLFDSEQAKRLFGFIAAGGSTGAIVGPLLTAGLSPVVGPVNLILFSILLLFLAVVCIHALLRCRPCSSGVYPDRVCKGKGTGEVRIGGGIIAGFTRVIKSPYMLGICLFILLYTSLSTFLYFTQARIVEGAFSEPGKRTALFASMDLAVNVLTLIGQVFLMGRLTTRLGVSFALMLIPAIVSAGFLILSFFPVLPVLVVFQVLRRAGNYSITRPAREVLFTVVPEEDKYKSKNFIDTVVYRGGDAVSGWLFTGLSSLGLGLSLISLIAVPISVIWMITGLLLGKKQESLLRGNIQHGRNIILEKEDQV